jgi:hypothetical protein
VRMKLDWRFVVVLGTAFVLLGEVAYRLSFAGTVPMLPLERPIPDRREGSFMALAVLLVYTIGVAWLARRSSGRWVRRICLHAALAWLIGVVGGVVYYHVRMTGAPPVLTPCVYCEPTPPSHAFFQILASCVPVVLIAPAIGWIGRKFPAISRVRDR